MGEKRKGLVEKFGYDTKNAAHLIRLLKMGAEILNTGKINVFRKNDAEELLDIKNGKMMLEEVKEYAKHLFQELDIAYAASTLKESVDMEEVSKLCEDIVRDYYCSYAGMD